MQSTLIFLLVTFIIGAAQSQSWAGTYIADSSCSTAECCCLSGRAVVTSIAANTYEVNSGATGAGCAGAVTFSGVAYTNGYSGTMMVAGTQDILTLSFDSRIITVTNPGAPQCSGIGIKSGAIKQHANIIMFFAIALVGVVVSSTNM